MANQYSQFEGGKVFTPVDGAAWTAWKKESDERPVVVKFSAPWCARCKVSEPLFEGLAASNDRVAFVEVDVEELKDVAFLENVRSVPTFRVYHRGEPVDEIDGSSGEELAALVCEHAKFETSLVRQREDWTPSLWRGN